MSPITVAFVTACTALIAAFVGPLITFRIGKAQISASVLSTNRQRWVETFRDLTATFCAQAASTSLIRERMIDAGRVVVAQDPDLLNRVQQLMLTFTKLKLMINPLEADHIELIGLLNEVMTILRTAPLNTDLEIDMQTLIDRIVVAGQAILKREWIRVKSGN